MCFMKKTELIRTDKNNKLSRPSSCITSYLLVGFKMEAVNCC